MKKFILLLFPTTVLMSCGGNSNDADANNTDSTTTDVIDSTANLITIDVNAMLSSNFATSGEWPYIIDSVFYEELTEGEQVLSAEYVKFLSQNFVESEISYSGKSSIDDVIFFDSLKLADAYEGYVEVLDIGMMEDATAHSICQLELDEKGTLLIWYVDFATYAACPYFAGQTVYASILKDGQVSSCTLIGESSGGGDAPYWNENLIINSLYKDKFVVSKIDRNGGDVDEEGNDIVDESITEYEISLSPDGIWVVESK